MYNQYPCSRRSIWLPRDFEELKTARTFSDLTKLAIRIISRFDELVTIVSGPISSGGEGSREKNFPLFVQTIRTLQSQNVSVFDQTPFEDFCRNFAIEWAKNHKEYSMPILLEFYEPLFRCGGISTVAFMHNWRTSTGSRWERRLALSIPLAIRTLPPPIERKKSLVLQS